MARIKWTWDEMLVVMAYYLRYSQQGHLSLPQSGKQKLSELFHIFHTVTGTPIDSKTRSAGSIQARYENFKTLDPEYIGTGLSNISKLEQQIWKQFYNNQEYLFKLADNIEQNLITLSQDKKIEKLPETDAEYFIFGGKLLSRIHHYRERNTKIIGLKKEWAWDMYGRLHCEACEFDFHAFYGDYGQGYIECHHNTPLAELHINDTRKTTLDDLSLLCANCHRMVHYRNPWETVAEIRYMIQP